MPLQHLHSAAVLAVFIAPVCARAQDDWVPLFTGTDVAGWVNPYGWGDAKAIDGELHLRGPREFYLVTEREFQDFEFEGEVLIPAGRANSGFMFRCQLNNGRVVGYQAEVDGSDRGWSGGLYDEDRRGWIWPAPKVRTVAKVMSDGGLVSKAHFQSPEVLSAFDRQGWNRYRITCVGESIRIEVNGVVTTEISDDRDQIGRIALQHHGERGQVYRFRNLRIREIAPAADAEAPQG